MGLGVAGDVGVGGGVELDGASGVEVGKVVTATGVSVAGAAAAGPVAAGVAVGAGAAGTQPIAVSRRPVNVAMRATRPIRRQIMSPIVRQPRSVVNHGSAAPKPTCGALRDSTTSFTIRLSGHSTSRRGNPMTDKRLTLTQLHIRDFLDCPRRFELRYLAPFVWPEAPYTLRTEQAFDRGREFHRLLERRFLALDPEPATIDDPVIRTWWDAFQSSDLTIPAGQRLAEMSLAVPEGGHQLFGRFDLLVLTQSVDDIAGAIFDWKTSKPRDVAWLRQAWQTRLYLALMTEGGHTLVPGRTEKLDPDRLSMTYWYVGEPHAPRIILYSRAEHAQNWADIQRIVAEIEQARQATQWRLTEEWARCRDCAFQAYCGRQGAGPAEDAGDLDDSDDLATAEERDRLEPDWG